MKTIYAVTKGNNLGMSHIPTRFFDNREEAERYAVDREYSCVWDVQEIVPRDEHALDYFEKLIRYQKEGVK